MTIEADELSHFKGYKPNLYTVYKQDFDSRRPMYTTNMEMYTFTSIQEADKKGRELYEANISKGFIPGWSNSFPYGGFFNTVKEVEETNDEEGYFLRQMIIVYPEVVDFLPKEKEGDQTEGTRASGFRPTGI